VCRQNFSARGKFTPLVRHTKVTGEFKLHLEQSHKALNSRLALSQENPPPDTLWLKHFQRECRPSRGGAGIHVFSFMTSFTHCSETSFTLPSERSEGRG
jgi:hypothetical protein